MQRAVQQGVHALGVLLSLFLWQSVLAAEDPPTLQKKAEDLLQRDTPGPTTYLYYPDNDTYQSVWLRGHISRVLQEKHHFGYSREQILRVKKFLCIDSEGTPGLAYYRSIAKWQAENEFIEDAQQTLREAVAFSRRLKANPPPKPKINGWCGCYEDTSPESRIACAMLRIGSSNEDVLSAAAEITPDWQRLQYMEEPYQRLAAQLGRHDLALELTRRMQHPMQAAIHCERVAEEILHSGDYTLAKLAFEQTLAMMPDPKKENWNRGDYSFPVRAAACLGHMGEYDLARKFLQRSNDFPGLRSTELEIKNRAEQYLDQAALGESKLPVISKDDPDYQRKVATAAYLCQNMRTSELRAVRIDIMETIPPDDPARFQVLFDLLQGWAGNNQDLPKQPEFWVKDLLRQHMELLPAFPAGDKEVQQKWRNVSRNMAQYLIRCGMLEPYRDHFMPETIDSVVEGLDRYERLEYPAFSLDKSIEHFQSRKRRESLAWKLTWWLQNAQNQDDAKRIATMLVEFDEPVNDPQVHFLAGNALLCRELDRISMDSSKYSVAGEKTEKDWYPLTDLMIDTYLRGENDLANMIAVKIIDRLWLLREKKLEEKDATRRHHEVAAAMLILEEFTQ